MPRLTYAPSKVPLIVVELERKPHETAAAFKIRLDHLTEEVRTGVAGLAGVSVTVRWKSVKLGHRTQHADPLDRIHDVSFYSPHAAKKGS